MRAISAKRRFLCKQIRPLRVRITALRIRQPYRVHDINFDTKALLFPKNIIKTRVT